MTIESPEELRRVVQEEVERTAVRTVIDQTTKTRRGLADTFFRHPLFITFVGFMMTSGLLWVVQEIVQHNQAQQQALAEKRTRIARDAEDAIALLDGLVLLAHQRATELSLITFALLDGDEDLTKDRVQRFYEIYREWVTTYQPKTRKILTHMGVIGTEDEISDDPFFEAVEKKLGWETFVLGHACLRRVLVIAVENDFAPYASWWDASNTQFTCPRDPSSSLSDAPITFMQKRYQSARNCATHIFFYARARILAHERARLVALVDRENIPPLPDPKANFPDTCQLLGAA